MLLPAPASAALAALLFLAAQVLAGWHFATVRHLVCPEHAGELVHVAAGAETELESDVPRAGPAAPEPDDAHDHCVFGTVHRERPVEGARPATLTAPHSSPEVEASPAALPAPPRAFALYLLAPKTSPPV